MPKSSVPSEVHGSYHRRKNSLCKFLGSVTRSPDRLNSYIDVEYLLQFVTQITDVCPLNVSVVQFDSYNFMCTTE